MNDRYNSLAEYYANGYGERNRFSLDRAHSIEFVTSMRLLLRHLSPGCSVLDCCAAAGAYAFPLAEAGYRVTAGDLLEGHVALLRADARAGMLEGIYQGDVLDLSRFKDGEFDAVLCMGALYHSHNESERKKCVSECLRLTKPGGVLAFAYINRNAVFINHFLYNRSSPDFRARLLKTGDNEEFYTMAPGEAEELARGSPLEKIAEAGVDGLIYPLFGRLNSLTGAEFDEYMTWHFSTCEEPSLIGHSMHILRIGRKV